ncbi:MAG: hypothetical protein GAK45_00418 [Pseudomonas citronellolis]|nr:MAG: hypothetical protein GAK45_00418 [Pseudomonas citronellolis]
MRLAWLHRDCRCLPDLLVSPSRASHFANRRMAGPAQSNQRACPIVRVFAARRLPSLHRCSRGTQRRAIPGPSLLSRHPCRSTPCTTTPLGLPEGRSARRVFAVPKYWLGGRLFSVGAAVPAIAVVKSDSRGGRRQLHGSLAQPFREQGSLLREPSQTPNRRSGPCPRWPRSDTRRQEQLAPTRTAPRSRPAWHSPPTPTRPIRQRPAAAPRRPAAPVAGRAPGRRVVGCG